MNKIKNNVNCLICGKILNNANKVSVKHLVNEKAYTCAKCWQDIDNFTTLYANSCNPKQEQEIIALMEKYFPDDKKRIDSQYYQKELEMVC